MALSFWYLTFHLASMCNAVSMNTSLLAFSENHVTRAKKLSINIINPLNTCVLVNISTPYITLFPNKQEIVEPNEVRTLTFDKDYFEVKGTGKSDKGILLRYNHSDISITGQSFADISVGLFFARTFTQLGTEYFIITHCVESYSCQFAIVASTNNTIIEILFPEYFASSIVFDEKTYGNCDVMNITLQEAQTFQLQSTSDLSGVKIVSTNRKRFSVLAGSSFTRAELGHGRDHIAEMVPPIAVWGKEYNIARRIVTKWSYDNLKFVAAARGANISIFGCGLVFNHKIEQLETFLYQMTCERVHIISDEPVLIAHFPVGLKNGDPAMLFPTPVSHYVSQYTVYIPSGFTRCDIALIMETIHTSSFNIRNFTESFTQWEEIEQSVYATAWLNDLKTGVVKMTHTSPFGGHLVCERPWAAAAIPIGLGNMSVNEQQELFSTTFHEGCSKQTFQETSTDVMDSVSFKTVYEVTTIQNPISSESSFNCSCCTKTSYSTRPSSKELLEMINKLKKDLTISKKNTSNYVLKITSAWDDKSSSAVIGVCGIVILCVIFGSVIVIDVATFSQKLRKRKHSRIIIV